LWRRILRIGDSKNAPTVASRTTLRVANGKPFLGGTVSGPSERKGIVIYEYSNNNFDYL